MQGGQAGYDGAVLAVIRAAGTGVASSTIQTTVGGTIEQVRAALHRLMDTGQIIRTGERKLTRYELAGLLAVGRDVARFMDERAGEPGKPDARSG